MAEPLQVVLQLAVTKAVSFSMTSLASRRERLVTPGVLLATAVSLLPVLPREVMAVITDKVVTPTPVLLVTPTVVPSTTVKSTSRNSDLFQETMVVDRDLVAQLVQEFLELRHPHRPLLPTRLVSSDSCVVFGYVTYFCYSSAIWWR